jgi:hypothetical protein
MSSITTANPTVSLLWGQMEPEKADKSVDRMIQPDMTVEWGIRTNSNLDSIYDPAGYHEGTVWPLVTGWASLACFAAHRSAEGFAYLKSNCELTKDFCLGAITEVLNGDDRVQRECPHQAWSEAMVIQPTLEGLLGIRVNAINRTISISPHVPGDWGSFKVKSLRAADNVFDISYERKDSKTRIVVKQTEGANSYTAVISPSFDAETGFTVHINGEPAAYEVCRNLRDVHVTVSARVETKLVVDVEAV